VGLEHYGLDTSERTAFPRDGRLRVAEGLWVIGDPAGPELHTHQAHYQGEIAVRMAMGIDVTPDYRALPRSTYTDPEASSVGLSLDQAKAARIDAAEFVADFASSSRGYSVEAELGHVTVTFDRATRTMIGAAIASPDASAAIHECVLAIKARVPVDVLADTIHAFPSTSRILNGLFAEAAKELAPG
jgi:dihydrolipoamide dehydrogenase